MMKICFPSTTQAKVHSLQFDKLRLSKIGKSENVK